MHPTAKSFTEIGTEWIDNSCLCKQRDSIWRNSILARRCKCLVVSIAVQFSKITVFGQKRVRYRKIVYIFSIKQYFFLLKIMFYLFLARVLWNYQRGTQKCLEILLIILKYSPFCRFQDWGVEHNSFGKGGGCMRHLINYIVKFPFKILICLKKMFYMYNGNISNANSQLDKFYLKKWHVSNFSCLSFS